MATIVDTSTLVPTSRDSLPHPSQNSQVVRLNTLKIAIIAISTSVLVLGSVAALAYLLFVRSGCRRPMKSRQGHQTMPLSSTLGTTERYGECEDSEYTRSATYSQMSGDHGGTARHLRIPSWRSFFSSKNDNESRRLLSIDRLSSREDEITQVPLSHAVSLDDATPYASPEESHLDSAALLPPHSRSASPQHLPYNPADAIPPSHRSSRGKQSSSGSGHDSDDSESMYSQASASAQFHKAPGSSLQSVNWEFPTSQVVSLIPPSIADV